jgi:ElaB/YqjD/DUF883 family membrane-anchored ribosome-binding protein
MPVVDHSDLSTESLIDVDSAHVNSVPADFESQEIKTSTQADRIEHEAEVKARQAEEAAHPHHAHHQKKPTPLQKDVKKTEKDVKQLGKEVEEDVQDTAREAGKEAKQAGKKTEKELEDFGSQAKKDTKATYHKAEKKADELSHEGKQKAKELGHEAKEMGHDARVKADRAGEDLRRNSDNPVYMGNMVVVAALSAALGFGAYRKYAAGELTWKVAGLWAGAVGLFAGADYYVSQ